MVMFKQNTVISLILKLQLEISIVVFIVEYVYFLFMMSTLRSLWETVEICKYNNRISLGVCSALNSSDIKILGVDLLPGYYDPFSGRTLTKGEVGCFLSHYFIWKEVRKHTHYSSKSLLA